MKACAFEVGSDDLIHCWKRVAQKIPSAITHLPCHMDTSAVSGFRVSYQRQELYACMKAALSSRFKAFQVGFCMVQLLCAQQVGPSGFLCSSSSSSGGEKNRVWCSTGRLCLACFQMLRFWLLIAGRFLMKTSTGTHLHPVAKGDNPAHPSGAASQHTLVPASEGNPRDPIQVPTPC